MQTLLHALGVLASLVLSFISSGMETALYRVSRVRLRVLSEQGSARAPAVLRVLANLDSMVTTILIDNNIAAYAGAYFITAQLVAWDVPQAELVTTAVVTPLFFVLTESLPKQIAYNHAERMSLALVRAFSVFRLVLSPMVWVLNLASSLLRRLLGSRGAARLGQSQRTLLLEHLNAGVAEKLLTEEQNSMAARIMELECISAGDSMIPLKKLALVPEAADRRRAAAEMARRRAKIALLTDAGGRPTGQAVTLASLILKPGQPGDPAREAAEWLERIKAGAAIPEAIGLFRRRHARHALVTDRERVVGLITTRSILDRIAGTAR